MQDIFISIKSTVIVYQVFLSFFALEVLFEILGVNRYLLTSLVRSSINNLGNISVANLLIKLIISILISMLVYVSIYYWVCRSLYDQNQLKVSYKKLLRALWFKFLVIMAVVLVPLRLIVEAVNSNIRIEGLIDYSCVFLFIVLKNIVFFFFLGIITKKYITLESKLGRIKYRDLKVMFTRVGLLICVMVIVTPISYYLTRLEFYSLTRYNTSTVVVCVTNRAFKAFYNSFIYFYITMGIFGKTQNVAKVRIDI